MNTLTSDLQDEPGFAAICESVRWWFNFDGPQLRKIERQREGMMMDDARRIALTYNFARNLPTEYARARQVVDEVNAYRGKVYATLGERADRIEATVLQLQREGATTKRLVSGVTKLTWFVSPKDWTPFDRLAATAIGAKNADTLARMRNYYRKLDEIGFLGFARRIDRLSSGTPFAAIGGTRILDKFLMFRGDMAWTDNVRPIAVSLTDAMPPDWRDELIRFAGTVIHELADELNDAFEVERPA